MITVNYTRTHLCGKALIIHLVKAYRKSCLIALVKFATGSYSYILSPFGLNPGFFVKTVFKPINFSVAYKLGYLLLLKYLNPNDIVFNLEVSLLKGGKYCRAGGTYAEVLVIDEFTNLVLVKLPTGHKIWVDAYCTAVLGRASNVFNSLVVLGKAGLGRNINLRPRVRGVAMNPVDHPHGGRTKTNSPEVTPWGKIAKRSH